MRECSPPYTVTLEVVSQVTGEREGKGGELHSGETKVDGGREKDRRDCQATNLDPGFH